MIDVYARYIVGWRLSRTAHAGFVLDALEQAIHDRRPVHRGGLIHHSDRGVNGTVIFLGMGKVKFPTLRIAVSGTCHRGASIFGRSTTAPRF